MPESRDMKKLFLAALICLFVGSLHAYAEAASYDDGNGLALLNQIDYSASLTTSGQPTEAELALIASAGYDRVIFLAFTNHPKAVAHEDDIVRDLGLQFIHIPVQWDSPSLTDFEVFAAVMQAHGGGRTLVHCEVNFRASVFGFLYLVQKSKSLSILDPLGKFFFLYLPVKYPLASGEYARHPIFSLIETSANPTS